MATLKVTKDLILQTKKEIPKDYHCSCNYCNPDNFLGEIWDTEEDDYFSQTARYQYYTRKGTHLCPWHRQGYRYAIQNFCPENGIVLDPTVGTGTAVVEAINNKRNGIGIELEFPEIAMENVEIQQSPQKWTIYQGDAMIFDIESLPMVDLIINGTPYPILGGWVSSDAPERKVIENKKKKINNTFSYKKEQNLGNLTLKNYYDVISDFYLKYLPKLKKGGYFIIIIKDLMSNKKPYLLHKKIIDSILEKDPNQLKYHGWFIHKHYPTTLFMNTYPKRFKNILIPYYQTAIVMQKI